MTFSDHTSRNCEYYHEDNDNFDHSISPFRGLPTSLVRAIHEKDHSTLQVALLQLCGRNQLFRELLSAELEVPGQIDPFQAGFAKENERLAKAKQLENEITEKRKSPRLSSIEENAVKEQREESVAREKHMIREKESAEREEQADLEGEDEGEGSVDSSDDSSSDEMELSKGEALCRQCRKPFDTLLSEDHDRSICRYHPGMKQWDLGGEETDVYWGFRVRPFVDLDDAEVQDKVKWSCCGQNGYGKWCTDGRHKAKAAKRKRSIG